jgi:glycosyltransferase involved in cell wall biosynthesis
MHIGFSLVNLAVGGAQTFLVQLAQGLAQRGHRLSYFVFADRSNETQVAPPLAAEMDAVAEAVRSPWKLLNCEVLQLDGYHRLKYKWPYLFHLHRCVETYHSTSSVRHSGPIYARHRVAISQAVQANLKRSSHLIYYGIPFPEANDPAPPRFDVAILGRIHPVKQHLLFLHICEQLAQRHRPLRGLIIGGHPGQGPYQQQVDAELVRLRQAGLQIHLTGAVASETVFSWLAQVKVLLVTSKSEGFGRMAVEAMACGVPVVANAIGGLCEAVEEGETGFLAQYNDVASFITLTDRLLTDEPLRQRLGRQGRAVARRRFSLETMLDAYERLYQKVAARHA